MIPGRVSVVIPSRNEQFLVPTVKDILAHAAGDVEVVVTLDGYWEHELPADDRVIIIHRGKSHGMRAAINAAVACSSGQFIFKLDAHCSLAPGWDEALKADCDEDWVVVPRRYSLDAEAWARKRGRTPIDYLYLSYPDNKGDRGGPGLHGRTWRERNHDPALKHVEIDDLMTAQGSAYFMRRGYYEWLGLLDHARWGSFGSEFQEVGFKAWLSGGRVVRNKRTWYAHLHKGRKYGRGYPLGRNDANKAVAYANTWLHDGSGWQKQTRPFEWMIRHFWPVPGWPADSSTWAVAA